MEDRRRPCRGPDYRRAAFLGRFCEVRRSALAFLAFASILACGAGRVEAELLPISPLPPERSLWINLEILPANRGEVLPEDLRRIEGGRLQAEEAVVNGRTYRKTSLVLPLANGDRREVVLLLAAEDGHVRMLGFHRIHRHEEKPVGTTTVFQSGAPNPLTGEAVQVPADTYTYLALCTALSSFGAGRSPLSLHLWLGDGTVATEVAFDGEEEIAALGTHVRALRLRVEPAGGKSRQALYWIAEASPHLLLQYRGPGDFLTGKSETAPQVLLRATASSEQVRTIFRD
jgi:hypothetical protein